MDLSKYWKTIVDTLQDGILIVGPGGIILAMNPAAERITGFSSSELVGKSCRELNCTGCEIFGRGEGPLWCGLFQKGGVIGKQCLMLRRGKRPVNIIKSATVLRDENGTIIGAVETLKDMSEIVRQQQEILRLKRSLEMEEGFHGMIGHAPVVLNLFELIRNVALTDSPVLITGESGTGKELAARAVHEAGGRRDGPFVKVNCAALNENLLESELFGHKRGAYTGAVKDRTGRFEAAHGGTIFLDEIGEIPMPIQVKLLRTLEEKEIERVGDNTSIPVDVRIVSATNRNLESAIAEGLFREDLYFRINVFPITCPPLRERTEDIPALAQKFIRRNNLQTGKRILGITPEAMEYMNSYHWPGNVRELRNVIEYAFVLCPSGGIGVSHLPPRLVRGEPDCVPGWTPFDKLRERNPARPEPVEGRKSTASGDAGRGGPKGISAERNEAENAAHNTAASPDREALIALLRECDGNQSEAARRLGINRVTVWKRMKRMGIDAKRDLF